MMKFPDQAPYGESPHDKNRFRPPARSEAAQWVSKKDMAWTSMALLGIAILTSGDVLWTWMVEGTSLLFDALAQGFESFFMKTVGLSHHNAQVASAYLDLGIVLVAGLFIGRKIVILTRRVQAKGLAWWQVRVNGWRAWWHHRVYGAKIWWDGLNWINKGLAIFALVALAIPLALTVSVGLGMIVIELL
jgi:hypothetical protein